MKPHWIASNIAVALLGVLALGVRGAEGEAPKTKVAKPGTLIIVDASGKEQTITSWKFVTGTRPLSWLAPAAEKIEPEEGSDKKPDPAKAPAAPLALQVRAGEDIKFQEGVLTLVPMDRLRSIAFDNENDTITVRASGNGKDAADIVIKGTTKYRGVNKVVLQAEVDKGDLGIAEIRYLGGVKNGIQAIRFPAPKVGMPLKGRSAVVVTEDGARVEDTVTNLRALYRTRLGNKLSPHLRFKKTIKVDINKLDKLVAVTGERTSDSWRVVMGDKLDATLILMTDIKLEEKPARLQGLLGQAPAGYQLFPMSVVKEVRFGPAGATAEPKEKPAEEKPAK